MKNQLLLIVTMIMLFANCIYGQNFVPVTRSNSGQSIQLSKDQVLEVRLPSQPSTGYGWYVVNTSNNNELYKKENVNNGIIKQIGNREFVSDEKSIDIVGAPGTQVLRFVGVSKGTTDLKLVYVRPWLKDAEPLDVYKIKIVNDGVYTGTYKPAEPLTVTADESNSAPKGATAIPTNFSWLDQGGCSPVKDQAQCGSCWDFAAMGCFEAAIKIVDFNTRDISEQWLINCSGQSGCQGGNCPFSYIKSYGGAVYESDLPYADAACNVTNTAATCIGTCGTYTHHEKITSYGSAGSSYTDYTNLKTSIYNYGPIWVTVEADGAAFNAYSGGILTTSDGTSVDHAVVLVGWNDTGGYWIMRNSWGTSWGENGYARIKYGVDKLGGSATYLTYGTISHTLAPRAAFGAATTTLNCHVQSIQFSDSSQNAPTSWLWNFGDNTTSTLQNPTHTYTASGTYTVSYTATNAYGNSTATKTNYITINLPASPTATGATSTGGSVTLTASGNGTLYWFDSPTGSTVLKKGTSYATPVLTKTDTFYVESVISHTAATVGKASSTLSTSTGGYYTSTGVNGEIFDAYEPLTIKSVTVYASKATNRTIYLKNSSGTVLDSLVTNVNGTSSVNLNFHVPVGAGYLLEGGISNYLWRETSGASYPYSISNVMSITGSTAGSGYYYYFYNWRVLEDSCYSARVPAIATLSVPASVNISANPSGAICAGTNVTFTAAPINGGANPTYQWQNNGMNISGATNATYTSSSLANSDVITCIMTSNASGVTGSPATSNSITMTVNPIITAGVSITANPSGAICVGTNVTFTAIPTNGGSTPTYQWQKNGVNIS